MSVERHVTDRGLFLIVKGEVDDDAVSTISRGRERAEVVEVDLREATEQTEAGRRAMDELRALDVNILAWPSTVAPR